MVYINCKTQYGVETVDMFETRREANKMVVEYNMSDPSHYYYYLSNRPTKEWRKDLETSKSSNPA